jgi:nicotinamidase-related amidase
MPQRDEIVINKTASGVFSSTNLHYVLNNLGIESLFVVGVYTNECVETTVRDACDLGYLVTVVDDCCATVTPELHNASLATLRDRYARIIGHDEAIKIVNRLIPAGSPPRS